MRTILIITMALCVSCASIQPKITEGRITDKYTEITRQDTGFPEFGMPSTTFICTDYYIIISAGKDKQRVRVTSREYEGLQIGWLVDVSKKYGK